MKKKLCSKLVLCFVLWGHTALLLAQDPIPEVETQRPGFDSEKIIDAYHLNDEGNIAAGYEQMASEKYKNGQYDKAEIYYTKAQAIFIRLQKNDDAARVARGLAKAQEAQNKPDLAVQNYVNAGKLSSNKDGKKQKKATELNENDANRLKNAQNPAVQQGYLNSNIQISQTNGDKQEVADGYGQLGDINLQQNKIPEAVKNYETAINESEDVAQVAKFSNQISGAYTASGQYDAAILVQKELLARPDIQQNVPLQIVQTQVLGALYGSANQPEEGLNILQTGYDLAIREHRTLDAKNSLEKITEIYLKQGKREKCVELYRQFSANLDSLLIADPTLVDAKLMLATEEKIEQLELEKTLKDQLIERKNRFNYALMAGFALLLGFLFLIWRALNAIKLKNKKIALQSLRREMNPHFVFNSLNSINQFIAQNNELAANKYLTSYSSLMRNNMENSNKDFVSLSNELEMLKRYLDLERMRFPEKFEYKISVADDLDVDAEQVPNMILQPHLENAIWHGLRYRTDKGLLLLKVEKKNGICRIIIEDNGIGLAKSEELKTNNQRTYQSRGLGNTRERIELLNQIYGKSIGFTMREKVAPETGTVVEVRLG
jgi:two-component system, sensor histidine kinase YesM